MTDKGLRDWREYPNVKAARAKLEEARAAVASLERAHGEAVAKQREAERKLAEREQEGSGATLGQVAEARAAALRATAKANDIMSGAAAVYSDFAAAEEAYNRAASAAQAETWPRLLSEYRGLAGELDAKLTAALASEEAIDALRREMMAQFGHSGDGWVIGPSGERIGNAAFGNRRLKREQVDAWRQWRAECGAADPGMLRQRAEEVAAQLKQLAAHAQENAERRQAEAEQVAADTAWGHTYDLDPGHMVRVAMRGVLPRRGK